MPGEFALEQLEDVSNATCGLTGGTFFWSSALREGGTLRQQRLAVSGASTRRGFHDEWPPGSCGKQYRSNSCHSHCGHGTAAQTCGASPSLAQKTRSDPSDSLGTSHQRPMRCHSFKGLLQYVVPKSPTHQFAIKSRVAGDAVRSPLWEAVQFAASQWMAQRMMPKPNCMGVDFLVFQGRNHRAR